MKDYEFTVLFHPDLEMNLDPALDKVKKLIESQKGKILKEENEGKKRMAYSIKKQEFAIYYYFMLELPPEAPGKISSSLNINDEVLRYLLARPDAKKAKLAARREAKASTKETNLNAEKGE